jgi:hypothetical protein
VIRALQAPMTRVERIGLVAGLVLAAALMWPLRNHVTDDTFIHLQYARHLAEGDGLVFNRGERVYGCTSPMWVTLIADGMGLGLDGLHAARGLGMLATLASVALFLQLMRRTLESRAVRAIATVAWAGHAWMLRWSTSGMETAFAVALTLAGFVAFTEGRQWGSRPVRTGALWGLACLARPELLLLVVLWAVALIIDAQNREGIRRMVFGILPPAAIYGMWLAFARFYFGTFWPQTLSTRSVGEEDLSTQLELAWRQVRVIGASDGILLAVLVAGLVFARRRAWPAKMSSVALLPWMWIVMLPAFYVARGVPPSSRYLLLMMPVAAWLAWQVAERWWRGGGVEATPSGLRRVATMGAFVGALVLVQNLVVYRSVVVPQVRSFTRGLQQSLIPWGRWFARHTPANALIATPEIGAIGYFSHRSVLDLSGLVTPEMVPKLEREELEDAVAHFRFAEFARPDFIVDREARAWDLERRSPHAARLIPLGTATVPDLGIARRGSVVYSFYRVDWSGFDASRPSP